MTTQLLRTKLYIPPVRSKLVTRSQLIEKLNAGLGGNISLISAPAGYGKTTLLSEWINQCAVPVGWLSLDQHDNDLKRFLAYMIASLQSIQVEIDEQILNIYQPLSDPFTTILPLLINQISAAAPRFVLILDDYHFERAASCAKSVLKICASRLKKRSPFSISAWI